MKILIIYHQKSERERNTVVEYLESFRNYSNEKIFYLNAFYRIPKFIKKIKFDAVIYHYSFCITKWEGAKYFNLVLNKINILKSVSGYKIAAPQDEYVNSDLLNHFFKEFGIKTVFTCFTEEDWEKVYPKEKSGLEYYFSVFPGYIDENAIQTIGKDCKKHSQRSLDVGYRARKVPYWLGFFGLRKWLVTEKFLECPASKELIHDVSNDEHKVFYGDKWYKFLGNCRVFLGSEGGASLHDPNGTIRKKVEDFVTKNPNAPFEEVEKNCFAGNDGNIRLYSLSPRHFEACITRTCQALVEGNYGGIFKPGVHYIEIKEDWSNIEEVIDKIKDVAYCEQLAGNAYRDIVESGKYTYREFVKIIFEHVRSVQPIVSNNDNDSFWEFLLKLYHKIEFLRPKYIMMKLIFIVYHKILNIVPDLQQNKLFVKIKNVILNLTK
ncbi:MAG: hypothetical protein HW421_1316 [Ignavibacteria bacterium]|nr:hypothetical protein [Ignavibacteria bacterium]